MADKLICFPFLDGNLLEYINQELDDSEREKVYNGEIFTTNDGRIVWKPKEEIELTLHYCGFSRGRSSVTFQWIDDNNNKYPMFVKDLDELLRQDIGTSNIHAIFTYVKRGANYGIKFLRRVEEANGT